jgi:hypothetical protein
MIAFMKCSLEVGRSERPDYDNAGATPMPTRDTPRFAPITLSRLTSGAAPRSL